MDATGTYLALHGTLTLASSFWSGAYRRAADRPCRPAQHGQDAPGPYGSRSRRALPDRRCHDVAYGRTDILIDGPGLFVIIENKLDATSMGSSSRGAEWHHEMG